LDEQWIYKTLKHNYLIKMAKNSFELRGLVSWKRRRDMFQNSDNVSGMGDQIEGLQDIEDASLTGSPTQVKFIMKDETNAEAMKALKLKWW
jgi:hypothetical protein